MTQSLQINPLRAWMMAARPRTLPAAASPVIVASALALHDGVFHAGAALACLLIALLMQIGANFANDLFDAERGADTGERLGPTRVTAAGIISPRQMQRGMVLAFGLAVLFGMYLATRGGWPVIVLGVAMLLAALAYSGGPLPYGYHALGDAFVLLSFGVAAVCGTYYTQALSVAPAAWWVSISMGLLIVNILVVNNTRDVASDRSANKRTLAVLFGRRAMLNEYLGCVIVAYLIPLALGVWQMAPIGGLLTWLSLPQAVRLYREFSRSEGAVLNVLLGKTAGLALIFAVLFSIGILAIRF